MAQPWLQLRLLGLPEIKLNGIEVAEPLPGKAQALLYYLAVTGRPQARPALAGLLWGDKAENAARANLRKALSNLRQLSPELLAGDHQAVVLAQGSYWLDVAEFEAGMKLATPTEVAPLQEMVTLYRGDFLEGVSLQSMPDFETWVLVERARLREMVIEALQRLAAHSEQTGAMAQGMGYLRRLLALEPWREKAHRQLMILLARDGQRSAALAQYEQCRQMLAGELGVEPDQATTALYHHIRDNTLPPPSPLPPPSSPLPPHSLFITPHSSFITPPSPPLPPPHNLPLQSTAFIGRQQEVAAIIHRLQEPDCRLLTLAGPGGIGKTRLALEVARHLAETPAGEVNFRHGIIFVPLALSGSAGELISAIAGAAQFTFYGNVSPRQQLLSYLREKQMLLLLDSFEPHLASPESGLQVVSEILATAPAVKLLITSREALNLQEEWFHPVKGLALPPLSLLTSPLKGGLRGVRAGGEGPEAKPFEAYDAVQLFAQSARQVRVNFSLAAEQQGVARICQLVEGMPLGIELAAAWLKLMPAEKIAQEIERNLDILATRLQNVPERHRSVRTVFEQSWQHLAETEQQVLRQLSTFQGTFQQEAAEAIAGASLVSLATLVEKSLVQVTEEGRYQMHELLRQFAAEKLRAAGPEAQETQERHSVYYLAALRVQGPKLTGREQQAALAEITQEIENIRPAWQWAIEQGRIEAIEPVLDILFNFYRIRSRDLEGLALFTAAINRLQEAGELTPQPSLDRLREKLLARRGTFYFYLGDYEAARHDLELSLELARALALEQPDEVIFSLNILGQVAGWQGNKLAAQSYFHQSLALRTPATGGSRERGDLSSSADVLGNLAQVKLHLGEYDTGKQWAEESVSLSRQLGRPDWIAHALDTLGWATFCLGEYRGSARYYQESLELFQETGNHLGVSLTLGGLGLVAWGEDRLPEAIAYTEQSLATAREIGHRLQISSHLSDLAQMTSDLGEQTRARQYGLEGLAVARELGSDLFAAYNLCVLGQISYEAGEFQSSSRYLQEARQIASENQLLSPLVIALFHQAVLWVKEGEGREQEALAWLSLLQDHPACWHVFRRRASRLRQQLEAELPAEVVAAARAMAEKLSLGMMN